MTTFSFHVATDLILARNLNALANRALNEVMSSLIKVFSSQHSGDFLFVISPFFAYRIRNDRQSFNQTNEPLGIIMVIPQ